MDVDIPLTDGVTLRSLRLGDGAALAEAYRRNRDHLAPWEPARDDSFYEEAAQQAEIARSLASAEAGTELALVLADSARLTSR